MNEHELEDIWKKNLREFNDVMRLDSLIIRAMQEAVRKAQSKQRNIADVGNSALHNDMPLIYDMCLSYRHDFALLNATEQEQLVFECKEWLRAYENNK
jgi:vacuolar-type H+-ATPase catalytic subunit A/Vma1